MGITIGLGEIVAAAFLMVAACKGGGGGPGDWTTAKRTELLDGVGGVLFRLRLPEGLVPDDKGLPDVVAWSDHTHLVGFSVRLRDTPITSLEAAVAEGATPTDSRKIAKQVAIDDGFLVLRTERKGLAWVDVYKKAPRGALSCHGSVAVKDVYDVPPATLAAMEAVCSSLKSR